MPADVPGLPLERGAAGEAVRDLQHRLVHRGFPVEDPELGVFGASTEAAVSHFQDHAGLLASGRCDAATWYALVEAGYRLGDRLLYLRRPMLRGEDVAQLQRRLGSLGFDAGRIDGIFGPDTERALGDFQRNAGLAADGIFGPDSERAFRRLGDRVEQRTSVAGVRERERLRRAPTTLHGRRVAIGHTGGLGALVGATHGELGQLGVDVLVLEHADPTEQATAANGFDAEVFIGVDLLAPGEQPRVAYYRTEGFESLGGHQLAGLVADELAQEYALSEEAAETGAAATGGSAPITVDGLRLPILRETRMPAVLCLLADPAFVVAQNEELARALRRALSRWVESPTGDL